MKIHRLLSSLHNGLTKRSSSYTIWFLCSVGRSHKIGLTIYFIKISHKYPFSGIRRHIDNVTRSSFYHFVYYSTYTVSQSLWKNKKDMLFSYCMVTFKIIIELGNTCNAKIHGLILFQYVSGITFRYALS